MADNYKVSMEWQALNRIWKAVPASARDAVKDDFRIITEMIKSEPAKASGAAVAANAQPTAAAKPAAAPAQAGVGETNFLVGLSPDACRLALRLMTKEGFNIHDYLIDLARGTNASDAEELFDAYVSQRDIDDDQEEALMEIIRVCIRKAGMR